MHFLIFYLNLYKHVFLFVTSYTERSRCLRLTLLLFHFSNLKLIYSTVLGVLTLKLDLKYV